MVAEVNFCKSTFGIYLEDGFFICRSKNILFLVWANIIYENTENIF